MSIVNHHPSVADIREALDFIEPLVDNFAKAADVAPDEATLNRLRSRLDMTVVEFIQSHPGWSQLGEKESE